MANVLVELKDEDGDLALYINEGFVSSWGNLNFSDEQRRLIRNLINEGIKVGKDLRSKEIRKLLGA